MRIFIIVAIAAAAGGCESRGPLNFGHATRPTAADDPSNQCLAAMVQDPALKPLEPRLGPFANTLSPTLEMRASTDVPTDEERAALSYWGNRRQACHTAGIAFRDQYAPQWARAVIDQQASGLLGAMAKLYARQINYGQFIAERERLASEFRAGMAAGSAQAQQTHSAAAAADAQRRQALAAENAQTLQIMQMLNPPRQPLPAPINCTTTRLGQTLNTQCN